MRAIEVHGLDDAGLAKRVSEARRELFNLRFQHAIGQLENTARLKLAKKDLARALTVARERGIDVRGQRRGSEERDG